MAKVSFGTLKLKKQENVNTIKIGDKDIEVLSYLPMEDKYDLIQATLQQSAEGIGFNDILLEMNLNLNIVFLYTNITFTEAQKEDRFKLYDLLESNGAINAILGAIPEKEIKYLLDAFNRELDRLKKENQSSAGIINNIMSVLPEKAQEAADILDKFDMSKMQDAMNFARAIGADV